MKGPISSQTGFTLVELLVVIAIIGILTGVGVAQYAQLKERAYDLDAQTNLQHLYRACRIYWGNNSSTSICDVSAVSVPSYGFVSSANITISGSGTESTFSATASHSASGNTLTINSAGVVS